MDSSHFWCIFTVLLLRGLEADSNSNSILQISLPCYRGDNYNSTLDNTIHLSDVILAGRIISLEKGEFDTYTAAISYYYSYKNDGLLQRRALWRAKVTNFAPAPELGQLGMFFLFREPSMQLSLFCMTTINALKSLTKGRSTEDSYQAVIKHIISVGKSKSIIAWSIVCINAFLFKL